jgi:hypothetical protein
MDLARKTRTPVYEASVREMKEILHLFKHWGSNNEVIQGELMIREGKLTALSKFLYALWALALRNESLFVDYSQTLSTIASGCDEAKRSFAMLQDTKASLLT